MNKTVIQLEFLKVEEGTTTLLTVPAECTVGDMAYALRNYLHRNPGTVLTEVYIDHEFRKEN